MTPGMGCIHLIYTIYVYIHFFVPPCCMSNTVIEDIAMKEILIYSDIFLEWKNDILNSCLEDRTHHSLSAWFENARGVSFVKYL